MHNSLVSNHRRWIVVLCGLLVALCPRAGLTLDRAALIFPNPDQEIVVAVADGMAGELPIGRVLPADSPLTALVMAELRHPYHRSMITVNQCLRNLSGDHNGPNVLFISSEEGGYARKGLVLAEGGDTETLPDLGYVDLVLDPERVRDGDLRIYSHELGHVMMANVWPDFPEDRFHKQHLSMGVTNDLIAFSEGWGEHFQRLAYDNVDAYRAANAARQHYSRSLGNLWHSRMDEDLRLRGVVENLFVHRKVLPQVDTAKLSLVERIFLEHTSPLFDRCRLKNAQEMLACEGVIATLFYRITTDSVIQHNYAGREFYQPFLLKPLPNDMTPSDVFTPMENALLKSAFVWSRMRTHVTADSAVFIAFVRDWCDAFPDDRQKLITIFLLTTVGRTVSNDLVDVYERLSFEGMIGNITKFREESPRYQEVFSRLREDVLSGRLPLDANVGPQLWVQNPDCLIPVSVFFPEPKDTLWINLNTASVFDLATFPKMSVEAARSVIAARDSLGYFRSVAEAREHGLEP